MDYSDNSLILDGWEVVDVGNLYVSPGIIDINVEINANTVKETLKKAVLGGVTTVCLDFRPNLTDLYTDCAQIGDFSLKKGSFAVKSTANGLKNSKIDLKLMSEMKIPLLISLSEEKSGKIAGNSEEDLDDYSIYTIKSRFSDNEEQNEIKIKPESMEIEGKMREKYAKIVPFQINAKKTGNKRCFPDKIRKNIPEIFENIRFFRKTPPKPRKTPQIRPIPTVKSPLFFPFPHSDDLSVHSHRNSLENEHFLLSKTVSFLSLYPQIPVLISPISHISSIPVNSPSNIAYQTGLPYLSFSHPETTKPSDPLFKVIPPIRGESGKSGLLLEVLQGNKLHSVTSYHQKVTINGKFMCSFADTKGGMASLGHNLSVLWTNLREISVNSSDTSTDRLICLLSLYTSLNPAKWLQINHKKGGIKAGLEADLVVWDPFLPAKSGKTDYFDCFSHLFLTGFIDSVSLRGEKIDLNSSPNGQFLA